MLWQCDGHSQVLFGRGKKMRKEWKGLFVDGCVSQWAVGHVRHSMVHRTPWDILGHSPRTDRWSKGHIIFIVPHEELSVVKGRASLKWEHLLLKRTRGLLFFRDSTWKRNFYQSFLFEVAHTGSLLWLKRGVRGMILWVSGKRTLESQLFISFCQHNILGISQSWERVRITMETKSIICCSGYPILT